MEIVKLENIENSKIESETDKVKKSDETRDNITMTIKNMLVNIIFIFS